MTAMDDAPAALVDRARWPIDDLDGPVGRRVLNVCHADMSATGCCNLAGFLTPEGAALLAAEAARLEPHLYWKDSTRNAYFTADDPALAADDPRRRFFRIVMGQVAGDVIPATSRLRRLHADPAMIEFVRRALALPALHPRADAFQDVNIIVLPEGGVQPWHYDQNHFSVTLLLRAPMRGGAFEFVPGLRRPGEENLGEVARLFRGEHPGVVRPPREAGTLTLFRGENAMHRVTEIAGPRARVTAILSYDEAPGLWAPDDVNAMIYGPRVAALLAARNRVPV